MDPIILLTMFLFLAIVSIAGYGAYKIGNYKPNQPKK